MGICILMKYLWPLSIGHTEMKPRIKLLSERPEKRGIDLATARLVLRVAIHYTTPAPQIREGIKNTLKLLLFITERMHML